MKAWQVAIGLATLGLVGGGIATNPSRSAYEQYATQQIVKALNNECAKVPKPFGNNFLQEQCGAAIAALTPQLKQLIAQNTQQQNYFLFSIYKTELTIKTVVPLPVYHLETMAALNSFYTYQAQQK